MSATPTHLGDIGALARQGALFVINHSGGKDSQCQTIEVLRVVPRAQALVVHATLGDIEWPGALELARDQAADAGVPFVVAEGRWRDGSRKTLLGMVEAQFARRPEVPSWPSSDARYCTSDLKRNPIAREICAWARPRGFSIIVSVEGIRAAESAKRARDKSFELMGRQYTNSVWAWYRWLPIHAFSTEEVFASIEAAGQTPHWAYAEGNERLSCLFCVFGSANDWAHAAERAPGVAARYRALERMTGYTAHQNRRPIDEIVAAGRTRLIDRRTALATAAE